ncbi:MAG: helix-turn-helix transcriptional regulator [Frankiales bacterium]|nr:helix-turn-helix transcriptional regulator [Frankiales bacterium]
MSADVAVPAVDVSTLIELFGLDDDVAVTVASLYGSPLPGIPPMREPANRPALERLAELGVVSTATGQPSAVPLIAAIEAGWCRREAEAERLWVRDRKEAAAQHRYLTDLAGEAECQTIQGGTAELNEWFAHVIGTAHTMLNGLPVVPREDVRLTATLNAQPETFAIAEAGSRRGLRILDVLDRSRAEQFTELATFQAQAQLPGVEMWRGRVPLRLAVIDGDTTVIPYDVDDQDVAVMVVRSVTVAETTRALLMRGVAREFPAVPVTLDERDRRLLALLATGCTDDVIARRMNVSDRTVRRAVAVLMNEVGADSRFQLGLRAARAGLV